jgi:hypothetical protein
MCVVLASTPHPGICMGTSLSPCPCCCVVFCLAVAMLLQTPTGQQFLSSAGVLCCCASAYCWAACAIAPIVAQLAAVALPS